MPQEEIAPRITIITSVYNGARYIEECIQSILGQTYSNLEHIIIDGGSTDGTAEILERYRDKLYYFISEKDNGIYQAWNKGLAKATGEWIAFVGSDDLLWDKQVVESSIPQLIKAAGNGIRYAYGRINLLSARSNVIDEWGMPWEEAKKNILSSMTVTHCCAFHHRSLFEEYGRFDESFKIIGDYEFLLRVFSKGEDAIFLDRIVAGMHAGGISANLRSKLTLAREHIRARQLNHLPATYHDRMQVIKAHVANMLLAVVGQKRVNKLTDLYRSLKGKEKIWSRID